MKILKCVQIRDVDSYTIKNEPIDSIDLMERASRKITNWILEKFSTEYLINIFVGSGNNGGDGLAIARQLLESNYKVGVFILKISEKLSKDSEINLDRLKSIDEDIIHFIDSKNSFPKIQENNIVIDALFGSGLTRPLEGLSNDLVKHINNSKAKVISVDIPSGLFGEDNSDNDLEAIIKAGFTLSFELPKLSFLLADNHEFVEEWEVLPIGLNQNFIQSLNSNFNYVQIDDILKIIKQRKKFDHKGKFGHSLIVAGSYGKMGASILATKACLRTGAGLVTSHIPKSGFEIMQTAVPEAMLSVDWSDLIITEVLEVKKYNAIGVGPGLDTKNNSVKALSKLFDNYELPMVLDADALNILSLNKELIKKIPKNSVLTPHPKEFERLVGTSDNCYVQLQKQLQFSVDNQSYIVLKGAYTSISTPEGNVYFNSTGNPGMATAGSGDVLTGIITSLLAQAYSPKEAAIFGVYLHGLAGDYAEKVKGQEALIASDIIENLGNAFISLKK